MGGLAGGLAHGGLSNLRKWVSVGSSLISDCVRGLLNKSILVRSLGKGESVQEEMGVLNMRKMGIDRLNRRFYDRRNRQCDELARDCSK